MTTSQLVLAGAASLVFAALAIVCAGAARRLRVLATVWRWVIGALLVFVVLVCWAVTLAPRTDSGVTCAEEPLFGMTLASDLASAACVATNRAFVAGCLASAGVVTLAAVVVARIAAHRRTPS